MHAIELLNPDSTTSGFWKCGYSQAALLAEYDRLSPPPVAGEGEGDK